MLFLKMAWKNDGYVVVIMFKNEELQKLKESIKKNVINVCVPIASCNRKSSLPIFLPDI